MMLWHADQQTRHQLSPEQFQPGAAPLQALISPGASSHPAVQAARQLGYWRHSPAARLRALLELCRDALDCWHLR